MGGNRSINPVNFMKRIDEQGIRNLFVAALSTLSGIFISTFIDINEEYKQPYLFIIGCSILAVAVAFAIYTLQQKAKKRREVIVSEYERLVFCKPTLHSTLLETSIDGEQLAIGGAVEIAPSLTLNTGINIERKGWDPQDIKIYDLDEQLDVNDIYTVAGKEIPNVSENNWTKFCLSNLKAPLSEEPTLELSFKQTKHHTIKALLDNIRYDDAFRMKYTSGDPR